MIEKEKLIGFDLHDYRPMIREKSAEILIELIKKHQPKNILEIGTFLGYSAGLMLENCDAFVTTIEKDKQNAQNAKANLENAGFAERFEVLNMDAMQFLQQNTQVFDFIFLDGPKGQYIKFLPYLKKFLRVGGVLIADDILFYGLVSQGGWVEHKHRTIVNNLRRFLNLLKNDPDFETTIFEIEDGIGVSIKK